MFTHLKNIANVVYRVHGTNWQRVCNQEIFVLWTSESTFKDDQIWTNCLSEAFDLKPPLTTLNLLKNISFGVKLVGFESWYQHY